MSAAVFTIAPNVPFVDALAAGLRMRLGDAPEALAEARILLPTRRACRSLALAFVRQSDGKPLLLPRMTPLGDIDEDDVTFDEMDALVSAAGAEIPPAISQLRRQLLLARHVIRVMGTAGTSPAQAAQLAAELGRLFDQVHTERLDLADLDRLAPEELARHWQITLDFLQPIARDWQETLRAEGCLDPADRRQRLLAAQAAAWRANAPSGPVIAAGSTGSMPATADLLAVISRLPNGAVVLPGLDTWSGEAAWQAIDVEPDDPDFALAHAHPQFGMAKLLRRLDMPRAGVRPWPHPDVEGAQRAPREQVLARALAPAAQAEAPRLSFFDTAGFERVTVLEAASPEEEARAIALIMRHTLEQANRTAALVTPDRRLARRVAAELLRWNIAVDDSGGQPLAEVPPATFLRLIARMVAEAFAPVPLLAVLKHPLAAGGQEPERFRRSVRKLEQDALHGLRPAPGIEGLRQAVSASRKIDARAASVLDALEAALSPLTQLFAQSAVSLAELLRTHAIAAEELALSNTQAGAARFWAGENGAALASFVAELTDASRHDPVIAPAEWPDLLDVLLAGRVVRPQWGRHPRLAIWGPLEARMQCADVMILGALNEESWPPATHAGPWMSRPMLQSFGLPLPERRIGLSAHDFCQAFAAPEVWLTRAGRKEGAPTVPCRWLLRLKATMHATGWPDESSRRAARILQWQRLLDAPDVIAAVPPPAPRPPLAARPRELSVTQIETWIRDPYSIYARHILRLRALDPLDAEPEAADFGTHVHAAIGAFLADGNLGRRDEARARLLDHGRAAFGELLLRPAVAAFWWPRFERIASWFVENEIERRLILAATCAEIGGRMIIQAPGGPFALKATADRIDRLTDGTVAIIDYKTGKPPSDTRVQEGSAPQLPLEAAIARAGGFQEIPAGATISAIEYWHLTGGDAGGTCKPAAKVPAHFLAQRAADALAVLVAAFDDPATAYAALPRPHLAPRFSDYAHLVRAKEWAIEAQAE
jgi:ATP-dependent helicase/nuclease subunit B